jgi:hypothetical protein
MKSLRTLINGNLASLSALNTTVKTSVVAAINEINTKVLAAAAINDAVTNTTTVWSGSKTDSALTALKTQLTNGAGAALDTFKELADAMGNDPTFAATITTALGTKATAADITALTTVVGGKADSSVVTALTTTVNGKALASDLTTLSTNVGDTTSDLVAIFNAGLV